MATPEQIRPLARISDQTSSDDESRTPPGLGFRRTHRHHCALIGASVVLLIGAVITALALTVFKVKEPQLTTNAVTFSGFRLDLLGGKLNVTVTADVSVKNPNDVSFVYGNSTTAISYAGTVIGVAFAPAGRAPARRTVRIIVTVNVMTDQIIGNGAFVAAVATGTLRMASDTEVPGRVRILGLIRKHVRVRMSCDFDVSVADQQVRDMACRQSVKF